MNTSITRRRFGVLAGGGFMSAVFGAACDGIAHRLDDLSAAAGNDGRLTARPRNDVKTTAKVGAVREPPQLGLDRGRDAVLQVPEKALDTPVPLLVLLHGAGGSGERILRRLGAAADEAGVAILAPDSRDSSWDAIRGGFGRDVVFLDRALDRVFGTVSVDPERVAVGGFSDGATYALSLGLINGDLFRRIVAFSPGFIVDGVPHGKPKFFISHGDADQILPIDQCSRVIVPALRRRGYDVTFREFEGRHEIPPAIAREGLAWVVNETGRAPV